MTATKRNRYLTWKELLIGLAIMALIPAIVFGIIKYNDIRLNLHGAETEAVITLASRYAFGLNENVEFVYAVDGKEYAGRTSATVLDEEQLPVTPDDMPIAAGDIFKLEYLPDNPEVHRILLDRPTRQTIQNFIERVYPRILDIYELDFEQQADRLFTGCLANKVYEKYGLDGLADVYFHDTPMISNLSHNSRSFGKLTEQEGYRQLMEECNQVSADGIDIRKKTIRKPR